MLSKFIFTIGHSNHSLTKFIDILAKYNVTAIADIRSIPYSSHNEDFNKEHLSKILKKYNISYAFLGEELGGKYHIVLNNEDIKVYLKTICNSEKFKKGIERLLRGLERFRIALMCAEKDPINCHRGLIIAPNLCSLGINVKHILYDGSIEEHYQTERRLINLLRHSIGIFLYQYEDSDIIKLAYINQLKKIYSNLKHGDILL